MEDSTLIYEKNWEALKKRYPGLDKLISEKGKDCQEDIEIDIELSENEVPILRIKKDGKQRYLAGKRNPEQPAKEWVKQLGDLVTNTPVYFLGIGNVFYLKELVKKTKESVNIIVYEPSYAIFDAVMHTYDLTEVFENRPIGLIIRGINEHELESVVGNFMMLELVAELKELVLPNYEDLYPEEALNYMRIIDRAVRSIIIQHNTKMTFATVTAHNILTNIKHLYNGYKTEQLAHVIPRDIPAIIVAAGPSLNKNIMELKKGKGKAFIIAVDTALRPLLKAGIVPDMFAMVDGLKPWDLIDVEGMENIPLLTSITAAREALHLHKGKKFFYNEGVKYVNMMVFQNRITFETVACGGSVAHAAFALAYMIGIDRIILVGQDLALTNNQSHADGTFEEKMEKIDTTNAMMVEGNYEEKVPTRADFKHFIEWYDFYIEGCQKRRKLRVINATEGGAKIKNTEIMTLKEAIEKECTKEVDIQECFDKLSPLFDEEQQKIARKYIEKTPEYFRELQVLAKKEQQLYKKLKRICISGNNNQLEYRKLLGKIKKSTEKMENNNVFTIAMTALPLADYIIRTEQFYEEDSFKKEGLEIARKGIEMTKLLEESASLFEKVSEDELKNF